MLFPDGGQVQVDHGRIKTLVTEILLDGLETDARFEQVSRVAVTKSVSRDFSVVPAQLLEDGFDATLDRCLAHRIGGGTGTQVISSFGRKIQTGLRWVR